MADHVKDEGRAKVLRALTAQLLEHHPEARAVRHRKLATVANREAKQLPVSARLAPLKAKLARDVDKADLETLRDLAGQVDAQHARDAAARFDKAVGVFIASTRAMRMATENLTEDQQRRLASEPLLRTETAKLATVAPIAAKAMTRALALRKQADKAGCLRTEEARVKWDQWNTWALDLVKAESRYKKPRMREKLAERLREKHKIKDGPRNIMLRLKWDEILKSA